MIRWLDKELKLLSNTEISLNTLCDLIPHKTRDSIRIKYCRLGYQRTGDALLRNSKNYHELLNDSEFCQIVDGELLGDGCVQQSCRENKKYYSFTYSTSRQSYAEYLHKYLSLKTNSHSKVYHHEQTKIHSINGKEVISPFSYGMGISHKVFESFYNRWYKDKKEVPSDVILTPLVCRHWYIGDGSITNDGTLHVRLSTDFFSKKSVEYLRDQLVHSGIKAKIYKERGIAYIVHVLGKNALKFLDYIGECPVGVYAYKWNTRGYKQRTKTCDCGKQFNFFGNTEKSRKHCSKECRIAYKKKRLNKRLNDTKILDLDKFKINYDAITDLSTKHYIKGLICACGTISDNNSVSISIKRSLLENINLLNQSNYYKKKIVFRSCELVQLLKKPLNIKKCDKKFFGDFLRGLFDACGSVNKTSDNHYMIRFRHRSSGFLISLSSILGLDSLNKAKELPVRCSERKVVFDKMYIQNGYVEPSKKYKLFSEAVNFKREFNNSRNKNGRFSYKIAIKGT